MFIKFDKAVAHFDQFITTTTQTNSQRNLPCKIIEKEKKNIQRIKIQINIQRDRNKGRLRINLSHHQFQPSSILKQIFPPGC